MLYKFLHTCSSKKLIFFSVIVMMIRKIAHRTFDKILAMMAMDWKKSSGSDFSARVTISKAILSHNFANLVFGIFSITITLYSVSVFTFDTNNLKEIDISTRPLILKMDFPFNSNTRFVYGLILAAQFFCTVLCGSAVVMLNTLLIVLVSKLKLF